VPAKGKLEEPLPAIARMLGDLLKLQSNTPFPIRLPLPQGPICLFGF